MRFQAKHGHDRKKYNSDSSVETMKISPIEKQIDKLEQREFIDKGTLAAVSASNTPSMAMARNNQ